MRWIVRTLQLLARSWATFEGVSRAAVAFSALALAFGAPVVVLLALDLSRSATCESEGGGSPALEPLLVLGAICAAAAIATGVRAGRRQPDKVGDRVVAANVLLVFVVIVLLGYDIAHGPLCFG